MAQVLYFTIGQHQVVAGIYSSPLCRLASASATPTILLEFNYSDDECITSIFQASWGTIYIATKSVGGYGEEGNLYSYNPATNVARGIVSWSLSDPGEGVYRVNPVVQMAEFAGKLYLACNGLYTGLWQRVMRLDPANEAFDFDVLMWNSIPSAALFGGVASDATRIFATDGILVYSSATGNSGDWTLDEDMTAHQSGTHGIGMFARANGNILACPAAWGIAEENLDERAAGSGVWTASNIGGADAEPILAMCFGGAATWAAFWGYYGTSAVYCQPDGGAWVLDSTLGNQQRVGAPEGLKWFDTHLFILSTDYQPDTVRLLRRDSAGNLTTVASYADAEGFGTYAWIGPLALVDEAQAEGQAWTMLCEDVELAVDVSFDADPTSPAIWTSITPYIRACGVHRGRQNELDRIEAGECYVDLDNSDRRFDPDNAWGDYYPNILPMRRLRVRARYNGTEYAVFSGFVEQWAPQWPFVGCDAIVRVTGVDGLKVLALAEVNETVGWPEERTDTRVDRILTNVNWNTGNAWVLDNPVFLLGTNTILGPWGDRSIGYGQSLIQAVTPTDTTALTLIRDCEAVEYGLFLIDRDGLAWWQPRNYRVTGDRLIIQAAFGDADDAVELPYTDLKVNYSDLLVYNDVRVIPAGAAEQRVQDATSQTRYYRRTLTKDNLPLAGTVNEHLAFAQYLLLVYKDARERVEELEAMGAAAPALLWPKLLDLEISDRVRVTRRPPGGGPDWLQESFVEGIDHRVEYNKWVVRLSLSPAGPVGGGGGMFQPWLLQDAIYGVLGSTTRLGY